MEEKIRGRGKGEGPPYDEVVDSSPVLGTHFFTKIVYILSDFSLIWLLYCNHLKRGCELIIHWIYIAINEKKAQEKKHAKDRTQTH